MLVTRRKHRLSAARRIALQMIHVTDRRRPDGLQGPAARHDPSSHTHTARAARRPRPDHGLSTWRRPVMAQVSRGRRYSRLHDEIAGRQIAGHQKGSLCQTRSRATRSASVGGAQLPSEKRAPWERNAPDPLAETGRGRGLAPSARWKACALRSPRCRAPLRLRRGGDRVAIRLRDAYGCCHDLAPDDLAAARGKRR